MTRFARAKGSKSSNERKPEKAASWSELKNSMLLKNAKKTEIVEPVEEAKNVKRDNAQENLKWVFLEDDEFGKSSKKKNLGKKRKMNDLISPDEGESKNKTEKKLKTKGSDIKKKNGKRILKDEFLNPENMENKCATGNKRIADEMNSAIPKKKMKKGVAKNEMNYEPQEKIKNGKIQKMKQNMKSNRFEMKRNTDFKNKGWNKHDKFKKQFDKKQKFKNHDSSASEIIINGERIPIVKFQGFNVTLEDAERLRKLKNELLKEGVPKNKLEIAIKLERRRAEKALSRLKKAVCFLCRGHGHMLSNCPNLEEKQDTSTGICYKCGSTEHKAMECKVVRETSFQFAECFICNEQGHIARQCPDNPKGLYPNGGACRECGDVTHLRRDCPKVLSKKADEEITLGIRDDRGLECLDEEITSKQKVKKTTGKKNATIKF